MNYFQAIIIAIVEGLTEFLPVSSTGHMIITTSLMGISGGNFTKLFIVVIQLGAIAAVVVYYWKRFINLRDINFYIKLFVGFIPIVILGFLLKKKVDMLLDRVDVVAWTLLLGGIFLLFIDRISPLRKRLIKGKLTNISKGDVDVDYKMKFPLLKK